MKKAILFFLIGVLLAGCSTTSRQPITQIYAFGDDLSDNGNALKLFKQALAQGNGSIEERQVKALENGFWQGRASNGPVAVEVLADKLKVGLTDYAVWSAMTGKDNFQYKQGSAVGDLDPFKDKGILGQIDQFETDLSGKNADPGALYFINSSMSDFYAYSWYGGSSVTDLADQAVANLNTAVTRLAKLGAKQIMVGNSPDLSIMPEYVNRGLVDKAKEYQNRFNTKLPGEMEKLAQQLGVEIKVFDFPAVSERIRSNPDQYGLTNLTDSCLKMTDWIPEACGTPEKYYFWYDLQQSSRVHQIMGEAMAEQLSN